MHATCSHFSRPSTRAPVSSMCLTGARAIASRTRSANGAHALPPRRSIAETAPCDIATLKTSPIISASRLRGSICRLLK